MNRIERLRELIASTGADSAIITHPANRRYLSGFPDEDYAPDESSGVLVVSGHAATLFLSPTNLPWAEATVTPPVAAHPWERPWPTFIGTQLRELGARHVLFEDRALSVADHARIAEAAEGVELVPAGTLFATLRAVKSPEEIDAIARAARITDVALAVALAELESGMTERQLTWRLERAIRDLGADGLAFPIIVASGPHSARPHHDPTDRPIAEGEPVTIDMGAAVDGYRADLTRTIILGEAPPIFVDRYNSVLRAQEAALRGIRAGMSGQDADRIAREALIADSYGDQLIHGLGHGVGVFIHEPPSLGETSDDILEPGHVVTIEPGIYFEDWGGIRIEDLGVVTETGLDILSNAPK